MSMPVLVGLSEQWINLSNVERIDFDRDGQCAYVFFTVDGQAQVFYGEDARKLLNVCQRIERAQAWIHLPD